MKFHDLHSYTDIYEVWIILKIIDNDNKYILKNWTNLTYWIIILFMLHLVLRNELKGKRRPHTKRKLNDAMRGCEVWSFLLIVLWDCRPQTPCFLTIENIKKYLFHYQSNNAISKNKVSGSNNTCISYIMIY